MRETVSKKEEGTGGTPAMSQAAAPSVPSPAQDMGSLGPEMQA